jgi:ubiquinone/menaquinone biosynthesis C-methylase UbiE
LYLIGIKMSKIAKSDVRNKRGIESSYIERLAQNWPEPREQLHHGGWKTTHELIESMNIDDNFKLLDMCCGEGGTACWIAKKFRDKGIFVAGFDILDEAIKNAENLAKDQGVSNNTDFRTADIFSLPFKSCTFDIIYGQDPDGLANYNRFLAFRELYRILKPNGKIIFHLWIPYIDYPKDELIIFENATAESGYQFMARLSLKEFIEDMKFAGFTRIEYEDMSKDYLAHVKKYKKKVEASGNKLDDWYNMVLTSLLKGLKIGAKIEAVK